MVQNSAATNQKHEMTILLLFQTHLPSSELTDTLPTTVVGGVVGTTQRGTNPCWTIIGQITPQQSGGSSLVWNCGRSTADYQTGRTDTQVGPQDSF